MGNHSADRLTELYGEIDDLREKEKRICKETQKVLAEAKTAIDPRKEFNNWLKSAEGKAWKQKQFEYQQSQCAYCSESLRFADAVVHHILPLKDFGSAANKPENFKLLHPGCNLCIGTKIVDF